MTPQRFKSLLIALGWSQGYLAERLGVNRVYVTRLANGKIDIPPRIEEWLTNAGSYLEQHPKPEGW